MVKIRSVVRNDDQDYPRKTELLHMRLSPQQKESVRIEAERQQTTMACYLLQLHEDAVKRKP